MGRQAKGRTWLALHEKKKEREREKSKRAATVVFQAAALSSPRYDVNCTTEAVGEDVASQPFCSVYHTMAHGLLRRRALRESPKSAPRGKRKRKSSKAWLAVYVPSFPHSSRSLPAGGEFPPCRAARARVPHRDPSRLCLNTRQLEVRSCRLQFLTMAFCPLTNKISLLEGS